MLARLRKQAARLGRKVTGWTDRTKTAQKWVADLTEQIDKLEVRVREVTADADKARVAGDYEKSQRLDKKALELSGKLGAKKQKRRFWIGRIKRLHIEKQGFWENLETLQVRIKQIETGKVRFDVDGNKVTGGTDKDKWIGACLLSAKRCGTGARANFYSQAGSWSVDRVFTGESYGQRSDCSQWVTSVAHACEFDDPNGGNYTAGGYTGTLIGGHGKWRETDRDTFTKRGWGYVVYGTGTGHHTEAYVGGTKTIGHGDSQINEGYLDMMPDRRYFIYG